MSFTSFPVSCDRFRPGRSAILYGGLPRVFYLDDTDHGLRLAYYTGSNWGFETLDGHQNGPMGRVDAFIDGKTTGLLYNNRPHVFFYDRSNDTLRHAYFG